MNDVTAEQRAEVAVAQQAVEAHTPPGAWPEVHLAGVSEDGGEATYEVGAHRLRVRGPVVAPGAPFAVTVALTASLAAAAMGRCPACGRVAELTGPDPEHGRPAAYQLLSVSVRVEHHGSCVAVCDLPDLRQWILPPFGSWSPEQPVPEQRFGLFLKHNDDSEGDE